MVETELKVKAAAANGSTLPLTRVQLVEKETGAAQDVDIETCARGVTCDDNKDLQTHLIEIHGHMEDESIHLTADEKKGLESTQGAQAKADAALAAAKEYADKKDVDVLQAAGKAADAKVADALIEAASDASTKANAAKQEAIQTAAKDAATKAAEAEERAKAASRPSTWFPTAEQVGAARAITRRLPVAEGYSVKAGDVVDVGKEPIKGPISSKAEGSIIQLNEGGKPVDFYVAKHDYENGLNGAGRTLVVRKESYDLRQWHSSNVNAYASSTIDAWLNGTYKNLLDADIRGVIGTTKFYYTPGNGNTSVSTLSRAIFLLSITELGQSHSYANTEGSALPIASTLKIANYNGSPNIQWTRSPDTDGTASAVFLYTDGYVGSGDCAYTYGSRPAFTLPATFPVKVGEGDEVVVKDIEPQANVERVFDSNTGARAVDLIRLSDKYCIAADIDSSGSTVKCFLLNAETGEKNYEGVVAPGGPTFKMVSLARLNDSRFVVGYLESGCLRAKVGTVNVTNFSFGTQRTAINSNLSQGILIALSDAKVLAIANRNGIDARVCTISGTEIDDDTGANHATVPGVTSVSRLSATLLPDDESGNKRVCVCFKDESDEGGKAVIATIDSADQVTWGDVVTWMDTFRISDSLSCCFDGDYVIVAAGNWVTVRAISIEPKLSVAGKPVNASHTSVSPQSALVHANGKSILLYNDRPSGGRKEGTRACIIHNQSGDLSFGPEFIFANNSIRGLSAGWASDGHVLAAYADGGNSNCGTCTILTVDGDQIAGSFLDKSSQAIALQDGNAGDLIDIIYSGTAELPGTAQGTRIESPGVQGYAPVEGLLEVFPWYLPGVKIATGSYVGTGKYGSDSPVTIKTPFKPKFVVIQSKSNISSYNGHVGVAAYGAGWIKISSSYNSTSDQPAALIWMDDGVSFYSGYGDYNQFNFKAEYVYTIFG